MKVSIKLTKSIIDDLAIYFGTMAANYKPVSIDTYIHKKNFEALAARFYSKKIHTAHKRKQQNVSISVTCNEYIALCFFMETFAAIFVTDFYLAAILPQLRSDIYKKIQHLMTIENSNFQGYEMLKIA